MFTIKWVASNGSEMIYAACGDVAFTPGPKPGCDSAGGETRASVQFTQGTGGCWLYNGTIYVMNETGATVAKYHLDD